MAPARTGAIIVGAGAGRRFGGDKTFALLGGRSLLAHSVAVFERADAVQAIVVVVAAENLQRGRALASEMGWMKVVAVCPGGARRQDSVATGLANLPPTHWTIVHDAARPFVTGDMITEGLAAAAQTGAAVAAVPVKDTIKLVGAAGLIESTPDRARLWAAQTPQVFRTDILRAAHSDNAGDATDDAALLERRGHPVAVFQGSYRNIKITTPEDLLLAECLLGAHSAD